VEKKQTRIGFLLCEHLHSLCLCELHHSLCLCFCLYVMYWRKEVYRCQSVLDPIFWAAPAGSGCFVGL
jgi:hypothetical protein